MTTIAGVFDNAQDAYRALHDLIAHGFPPRMINFIANDVTGEYGRCLGTAEAETLMPGSGDKSALVGGIAGLLSDPGAVTIPGIGSALVAGPISASAAKGLPAALAKLGVAKEQAGFYAEAVRRGSTLMLVATDEKMADRAAQLIERHGPVDLARRVVRWKAAGWSRYSAKAQPYQSAEVDRELNANQSANERLNSAGVG